MIAFDQSPAPAPAAPRKPSKLMVDLGAAIRATAEAARDQALAQVDADVAQVVEAIRTDRRRARTPSACAPTRTSRGSGSGPAPRSPGSRRRPRAGSRPASTASTTSSPRTPPPSSSAWARSRAPRPPTALRCTPTPRAWAARTIPSRLATLAESMPEPPELEAWADLSDLSLVVEPRRARARPRAWPMAAAPDAEAVAETIETVEAVADEPPSRRGRRGRRAGRDPVREHRRGARGRPQHRRGPAVADDDAPGRRSMSRSRWPTRPAAARRVVVGREPRADDRATMRALAPPTRAATLPWPAMMPAIPSTVAPSSPRSRLPPRPSWPPSPPPSPPTRPRPRPTPPRRPRSSSRAAWTRTTRSIPRPRPRCPPAWMPAGSRSPSPTAWPSSCRTTARATPTASRAPPRSSSPASSPSPASRASSATSAASRASRAWPSPPGPAGEFVFNVTHRPDVSFRDAIPTMPGFAARVTSTADGVVHVTARDPEAEG